MIAGVHGTQLRVLLISGLIAFVNTKPSASQAQPHSTGGDSTPTTLATQSYAELPFSFEANGQNDGRARFVSRGNSSPMYLTNDEALQLLKKSNCSDVGIDRAHQPARANVPCLRDRDDITMRFEEKRQTLAMLPNETQLPGTLNAVPLRSQFADAARVNFDDAAVSAMSNESVFRTPANYQEAHEHREWIGGRFTLGRRHTMGFKLNDSDKATQTFQQWARPERSLD